MYPDSPASADCSLAGRAECSEYIPANMESFSFRSTFRLSELKDAASASRRQKGIGQFGSGANPNDWFSVKYGGLDT